MKKVIAILLTILVLFNLTAAIAEKAAEGDYSWLDDLTIKQLKELDTEIHKRIPNEEETLSPEKENKAADILLGKWECILHLNSEYKVAKDEDEWDEYRYTLEFYEGNFGRVEAYNVELDSVDLDAPCTYELKDDSTIAVNITSALASATLGYKLQEDEQGPCLVKIGDDSEVYHKVIE